MGRIARLLSFVRVMRRGVRLTDVKADPGGGANVTAAHFAAPGDDSNPLRDDYVALLPIPRSGGDVVVGYADTLNAPKAEPGEKRIYARDADTGAAVAEVWIKSDGSIRGANALGHFELGASGVFSVNGVTIATDGTITTPAGISAGTSLVVDGKEMRGHTHAQPNDGGGNVEVETLGPT